MTFMDYNGDNERDARRKSAFRFCRNVILFAIVTSALATIVALVYSHGDVTILRSTPMLICYGIELFLCSGATHVAIFGWQEK